MSARIAIESSMRSATRRRLEQILEQIKARKIPRGKNADE